MTLRAVERRAIIRAHLATAVIAIREAEQVLNSGEHESLFDAAVERAERALARLSPTPPSTGAEK